MVVGMVVAGLLLAGCGGDPVDEGPVEVEVPESVAPADVAALGDELSSAGWACGEPLVDGAGYDKVVCGIPDDLMTPGMTSNAVGVHAWSEGVHVDTYREMYLGEDVLVVGEGWFIAGPTQAAADAAAGVLVG